MSTQQKMLVFFVADALLLTIAVLGLIEGNYLLAIFVALYLALRYFFLFTIWRANRDSRSTDFRDGAQ